MDAATRRLVRERAANRCEYCRIPQDAEPLARFHVEHVIARKHGGDDDLANLALACHHCNLHKGSNLSGIDPQDGRIVRLYPPRRDLWDDHFFVEDASVLGHTPVGRATVRVLEMNLAERMELRTRLSS
jgi:5-methylcytosine-specific restriction endonuclease McrA